MLKWLKNAWPWKSKSMTTEELVKSWVEFNQEEVKPKPALKKATTRKEKQVATKPGLYANIHAKQERIKKEKAQGKPVETMRKPGTKGAPTAKAFKESAKTTKKVKK
jgi:2-keto-4-pentenoate hydratase